MELVIVSPCSTSKSPCGSSSRIFRPSLRILTSFGDVRLNPTTTPRSCGRTTTAAHPRTDGTTRCPRRNFSRAVTPHSAPSQSPARAHRRCAHGSTSMTSTDTRQTRSVEAAATQSRRLVAPQTRSANAPHSTHRASGWWPTAHARAAAVMKDGTPSRFAIAATCCRVCPSAVGVDRLIAPTGHHTTLRATRIPCPRASNSVGTFVDCVAHTDRTTGRLSGSSAPRCCSRQAHTARRGHRHTRAPPDD